MQKRLVAERGALACLLVLALALRWPVPVPAWTHFDEIAFIVLPLGFWGGDFNPHYFNYPTFHFYFNSLLYYLYYLATGTESLEHFVAYRFLVDGRDLLVLARLANALLSAATVAVAFCLGRRLYGARAGLWAALVLACMPLAVRFAPLANTDTPAAFWVALALLWAVRARQEGRLHACLVAGVCTGLAGATKYPAALVALPVALAVLERWPTLRAPAIWICGGAALLGFALATPFVWLDAEQFWRHFADMGRTHVLGEESAALYHLRYTLRYGLGAVAATALVPALLLAVLRPLRQDRVLLAGILALAALPLLSSSAFMRYALPLAPLLALLLARLLEALWQRHLLMGGLALLALVAEPLWASLSTRALLAGEDTREQAQRWLREQVPQSQFVIEVPSPCGQLDLLTPGRLYVRQSHYLRSYGSQSLQSAYLALSRRDGLPPLYLDFTGAGPERPSGEAPSPPVAILHYQHPICGEGALPPRVRSLLEEGVRGEVFAPGAVEGAVFETMDWYFAPLSAFDRVQKTGPTIRLELVFAGAPAGRVEARSFFEILHWIWRGHAAMEQGDWRDALGAYGRVLAAPLAPEVLLGVETGRHVYARMGRAHAALGHGGEAITWLEKAAALEPADADTYNELGVAYASAGALDRAVQTWEKLARSHPDFAPVHFNLGRALLQLGQYQRARGHLQRAAQLAPGHPLAKGVERLPVSDE